MKIQPIRNEADYEASLRYLDTVIDAEEGTAEANERDVLAILIEKYEEEHYPIDLPDPVDAIRFRMEQLGIGQKDLIPCIGSRSKVSEILSGKRELTLKMIRALNRHLGIPAEVLVREKPLSHLREFQGIDFDSFPITEMARHGAFRGFAAADLSDKAEECIRFLIEKIGGPEAVPEGLLRKSESARMNAKLDPYALRGWSLQVLAEAVEEEDDVAPYERDNINDPFLRTLVGLSILHEGPWLAKEFLRRHGLLLEIVPHLKNTYLDGAAFITKAGRPVIGLTLRYDRIDNFWFTLLHEIGHIRLHLERGAFIADDMTLRGSQTDSNIEREADRFAEDALLPDWSSWNDTGSPSKEEVLAFASSRNVHPAIVAGRIQHARNNFKLFANLVGRGEVRPLFER